MMWLILIVLLTILSALLMYLDTRKPHNFPPGPSWFPIIGSASILRNLQTKKWTLSKASYELSLKYGSLVGLRIGRKLAVFVNGFEAVQEMCARDELNGRPDDISTTSRTWGKRLGLIFIDSERSQEQRSFVLKQFKGYGFRKEDLADIIENEVGALIEEVKEKIAGNRVLRMADIFDPHIANAFWRLISGGKIAMSHMEMEEFQNAVTSLFQNTSVGGALFTYLPFLRHICPDYCGYNQYVDVHKRVLEFIRTKVEERKETCNQGDSCGLIEGYLRLLNDPLRPRGFSEDQLLAICLDLIIGGFETSARILGFIFLYLLLHPDVQRKAHDEIDRVVGRGRRPILEDKPRLPYVDCIVLEALRLSLSKAVIIPRRVIVDTIFHGYAIPKDTLLLATFRGIFRYEDAGWKDPKAFNPERFMKNGRVVVPENFIPFGLGKRRCVGETFARPYLFLFVAGLLQTYHFGAVPGNPPLSEFMEGFTPAANPFKAIVTLR